ncbi:MAG: hypothetical protein KGJ89_00840 [Patescibacteria group bacterium]|nr:hypothetical protein [Patescibacteria group bacterium]MDE2015060.1 hypothetical protein [Patescibacteria group bacterium]MDE2226488.1 hypothetical protein [Patescibacteria group bacterium]
MNEGREKEKPINIGLSSANRNLIVALVAFALLIWGPIDPYGIIVRLAYLIIIPPLVWFILLKWGRSLRMDFSANDYFNRAVVGVLAGILLASAFMSYTSKYHYECTQYEQTYDGRDCVGDYTVTKGPDYAGMFIEVVLAGVAFWYASSKRIDKE